MLVVLHIARRELRGSLETPIGWVVLTIFVLLTGLFFGLSLSLYHNAQLQATFDPYGGGGLSLSQHLITPFFYNTAVMLVFLCPAVSMRTFAEDRRSRSLELLMTSPVSTAQIVLGKYLGALAFVGLMLACTLHYPLILVGLGGTPDLGVILGGYMAMLLLGGSYLAIGLLASSWTENQVVALVSGFGPVPGTVPS